MPAAASRCYHFLGMDTALPPLDLEIPQFDPSLYPRSYRVSPAYGLLFFVIGAIAFVAGCLGAWYFGTGHEMNSPRQAAFMAAGSFLFVLLGIYLIAFIVRFKVVLNPDSIAVQELFSSRTLLRSDIGGRRLLPTKYVSTLVLVPRSELQKKLKVGLAMRTDSAFKHWLTDIPNLDAEELAQSQSELLRDPDLGFESEERSASVVRAKKLSTPLNALATISSFLGYLFPRPPIIAILCALPLIALALLVRFRGIYDIEGRRIDARPSLAPLFLFPGLVLALRALLDFNLLHWTPLLTISLVLTAAIVFVVANADRSIGSRPATLLLISLFAACYSYGLAAHANSFLDHSTPQTFPVPVVGKHVSDDRSPTYYLHLDPWGPQTAPTEVSVPSSLYASISPGRQVCVYLHSGALRIPWYVVAQCL